MDTPTIHEFLAAVNQRAYEVDTSTRSALRGLVRVVELLLDRVEDLESQVQRLENAESSRSFAEEIAR